jgi:regulator of protease activity HflC (stomatin/prohibitin superfamily)
MRNFFRTCAAALALALITACTVVDSTEHCVETRYGKVVNPQMDNGLNATIINDATCFTVTDQNYPANPSDTLHFEAQTADPVTITGTITAVVRFRNVDQLYLEKRTPQAAEQQAVNALNAALAEATQQLKISQLFGEQRGQYSDSVRVIAQRKAGPHIEFKQIFIKSLHAPPAIEQARIGAAQKEQVLDAAIKQLQIDSANARGAVIKAEAEAQRQRLEAQALETSPAVLKLKQAQAMADGIGRACGQATTCIIGGSVMDTWKQPP